jgi:hypothetical protein
MSNLPERQNDVPAEQQGVFRKFEVRRVDGGDRPGGKHHGCEYFVLDVDHDPCAAPALAAYADAVEATHPTLAADMRARFKLPERAAIANVEGGAAKAPEYMPIQWPKARDVGRFGDMSPRAHLRVGLDSDNDAYASVWDEDGGASVEFCTAGAGGGKSSRTREALIALMVAMEADNAADPSRDWWARRIGGKVKGGAA